MTHPTSQSPSKQDGADTAFCVRVVLKDHACRHGGGTARRRSSRRTRTSYHYKLSGYYLWNGAKCPLYAELTWVKITEMKSFPHRRDFRLMVQVVSLSLSPSFSSISTTTSLHVFQVGRQDSMNLMPLHAGLNSRFGPRSNRCKHEFQRVRRLPTIGELTTRTKNKDNHYPLSPESCRVPWTENNN